MLYVSLYSAPYQVYCGPEALHVDVTGSTLKVGPATPHDGGLLGRYVYCHLNMTLFIINGIWQAPSGG